MHKSAFFKENHFSLIGGLFVLFRMDFFSIPAINEAYANIRVSSRFFVQAGHKTTYRISANSFRGNYSFLNLCLCTYCDLWWQYIQVRKLFKGGNYSRAETIWGNTVVYILQNVHYIFKVHLHTYFVVALRESLQFTLDTAYVIFLSHYGH